MDNYKESRIRVPRVPPWCSAASYNLELPESYYSTKAGCQILCDRIVEAWRLAGYDNVTAKPKRASRNGPDRDAVYVVKTNLVNGLPPRIG